VTDKDQLFDKDLIFIGMEPEKKNEITEEIQEEIEEYDDDRYTETENSEYEDTNTNDVEERNLDDENMDDIGKNEDIEEIQEQQVEVRNRGRPKGTNKIMMEIRRNLRRNEEEKTQRR